jgi:hypothetical protein
MVRNRRHRGTEFVVVDAYDRPMPRVRRVGDLVRTTAGTWITKPPSRCTRGHELGPNQVLVGQVACLGHGGGGHTTWHCGTCPRDEPPTYGPPLAKHCTVLEAASSSVGRLWTRTLFRDATDTVIVTVAHDLEATGISPKL